MVIQGYNISMIRGDTETIKVSVKDIEGVLVPLVIGDTKLQISSVASPAGNLYGIGGIK